MSEHQNIEWKQSWRDDYLQWVSGFANAKGGVIHIGKDDNGNVVGVSNHKKLMDELPNKIKDTTGIICEVNLLEEKGKYFIEIIVPPVTTPVSYKGKFYLRSGSTNQLLNGVSLKDFLNKKLNVDWDEVALDNASIKDIDENAIEVFKKSAIKSGRLPFINNDTTTEDVLKNLRLVDEQGKYKRAAVVLFAKDPIKFVPSAYIKIGKFGKSHTELLSQEVIEGNAIELADKTIELLDRKYLIRNISYKGLQRIETPEYPFEAIREILFNAIIHREYENTPVFISLYDDRISIMNQGELTEKLSIEDLKRKHLSYPRNELLATVFYKAGYIETWGRGTLKVMEECEKYGLAEPKIEVHSGGFSITLFKDIYNEEYLSKVSINDRQKKAIQYIKQNKSISNSVYRELFEVAKRTAVRDIEELMELKMIMKRGEGRATEYIINVNGYITR